MQSLSVNFYKFYTPKTSNLLLAFVSTEFLLSLFNIKKLFLKFYWFPSSKKRSIRQRQFVHIFLPTNYDFLDRNYFNNRIEKEDKKLLTLKLRHCLD